MYLYGSCSILELCLLYSDAILYWGILTSNTENQFSWQLFYSVVQFNNIRYTSYIIYSIWKWIIWHRHIISFSTFSHISYSLLLISFHLDFCPQLQTISCPIGNNRQSSRKLVECSWHPSIQLALNLKILHIKYIHIHLQYVRNTWLLLA